MEKTMEIVILINVSIITLCFFYVFCRKCIDDKMVHKEKQIQQELSAFLNQTLQSNNQHDYEKFSQITKANEDASLQGLLSYISDLTAEEQQSLIEFIQRTNLKQYIVSRIPIRNMIKKIFYIRSAGNFRIEEAAPKIEECLLNFSDNVDLQYHGLLYFAYTGNINSFRKILLQEKLYILLPNRLLQEVLGAYTGDKKELLTELLSAADEYIKTACIKAIGKENYTDLVPAIAEMMETSNHNLRIACIRSLALLKAIDKVALIEAEAVHDFWEVRAAVMKALGHLNQRTSLAILERGLSDKEWWVRKNAAVAIAGYSDNGGIIDHVNIGEDTFAKEALRAAVEERTGDKR